MISTTAWTVAAVLAAIGVGAWAYQKKQAADATAASPKAQYDLGYAAGHAAGNADGLVKSLPKVVITAEQADTIIKNPASWMTDPGKAYIAGYNVGYFQGYQDGLLGKAGTSMMGKIGTSPWIPPATIPDGWPASCPWPPKSQAEMDGNLAKAKAFASDPMATAQPSWWPSSWGWPPICPPASWPASAPWPPKTKAQMEAITKPGPITMTMAHPGMATSAFSALEGIVAKTPCETAFDKLPTGGLVYTSDSDRSYAPSYPALQDWAHSLYTSGTPLEKWVASRVLQREADAGEAAGADATLVATLRAASDCLAVPISSDDLSVDEKAAIRFADLPAPMSTNTSMTNMLTGAAKPWSPDGLSILNDLHSQGYTQAAQDFRAKYSPDLSGDIGSSGSYGLGLGVSLTHTKGVARPALGGRISSEWKNQVPQWYFHNSFRSMRG